jgi:hypothetical protein
MSEPNEQTGLDIADRRTEMQAASDRPNIAALFQFALENGKHEALRELVTLKREMDADDAKRAFAAAKARFQATCPPIPREKEKKVTSKRTGSSFITHYAPLETIGRVTHPHLTAEGLSFSFSEAEAPAGFVRTACTLSHKDGHSETYYAQSPIDDGSTMSKQDQYEATRTYSQRKALSLALGITTAETDVPGAGGGEHITESQAATLSALLDEVKADRPAFLKWAGADSVAHVAASKYEQAVAMLERKRG